MKQDSGLRNVPAPGQPESFSTAEVARMFGVSMPTIQRWVDQDLLKAWKTLGGHRRVDADSARRLLAENSRRGRGSPAGDAESPVVLIVEDDASDQELLRELVHVAWPKAQIVAADNGFLGLVALGQRPIDIVLSDIMMPHMNGAEMLRQLAGLERAAPRLLVAVSSLGDRQIAELGGLPPRVLLLRKPLEPDLAKASLRSAWQQAASLASHR